METKNLEVDVKALRSAFKKLSVQEQIDINNYFCLCNLCNQLKNNFSLAAIEYIKMIYPEFSI